ncbi:M55 family metallopeptidase [Allostreptomyces psammosilenae]|uniref:D-amino peptidase n=1 Tax=Allostreptomyces psammosilenae TaxID=1892865 RepID=A0A852ZU18_9ACTN|nr:M55 family metallopeptidase [Allostreptomyces psammosilenae]NYI04780.1 D-amino peptidase [Allostreptomyces psammosilenae]
MRVMISADMEGATGVTWPADVAPGSPQWQRFRRMLTGDVNAAVDGFLAGGADEVVVVEAHSSMRNVLLEELDTRATMITGRHKPLSMMQGVDEADAVAFVGYHTGAGRRGVLAHTYLGAGLLDLRIDGAPAGEGRMNALLAAEFDVPVALVTGDDLTCAEAADYAPGAHLVPVKFCVSRYAARCLPPARTAEAIREAARRAAGELAGIRAEQAAAAPAGARPHRFEVEFTATHLAEAATLVPGVELIDPRTVGYELGSMREAVRCFTAVSRLASAAKEADFD